MQTIAFGQIDFISAHHAAIPSSASGAASVLSMAHENNRNETLISAVDSSAEQIAAPNPNTDNENSEGTSM